MGVTNFQKTVQFFGPISIGYFRAEAYQAINCTGTDNQNMETKHYIQQNIHLNTLLNNIL